MYKQFDWVKYKTGRKPIPLGYVLEILNDGAVIVLVKPERKIHVRADEIELHKSST